MNVTDGDRDRAAVLMDGWDVDDGATYLDLEATIAAALAEEREKARAPFRDLVAFYDRHEYSTLNVDDLRQILEVTE